MKSVFSVIALGFLSACASGPCHQQPKTDQAAAQSATTTAAPTTSATATASTPAIGTASAVAKVKVYKADGSKQCAQTKGTDLKVMEKQLTKAGIKVFSSAKQPDGMMHTQVCGAATGMANTYEINSSDLKKAEKLGFSRLEI
jgi:hypothetical protein